MIRLFSFPAIFSSTMRDVPLSIIAGEHRITHGGIALNSVASHYASTIPAISPSSTLLGMVTLRRSKGLWSLTRDRMVLFIMSIDRYDETPALFPP